MKEQGFSLQFSPGVGFCIRADPRLDLGPCGLDPWLCDRQFPARLVLKKRESRHTQGTPLDATGSLGVYTIAREAGQVILELEDNRYAKWAALRIGCAFAAEGKGRGLLLHATGLAHTERSVAVIGLAQSGGGKSTLTDLALGWHSLSDETVYVEASDDAPCAYGLPFRSSASKQPEPLAARIGAFLILEKSLVSGLEPVSQDVALRALLNQAYRPLGLMESQSEFFRCAARIARSAPCFRFKFDKTLESVSGLLNQFLDDHRLASHPR